MDNSKEVTRVNMKLSKRSLDNVSQLSEIIGDKNRTRVIASALEIANAIMKSVKSGKHIILRDEDGSEQEMKFIVG
jgi:hypothetical protein